MSEFPLSIIFYFELFSCIQTCVSMVFAAFVTVV